MEKGSDNASDLAVPKILHGLVKAGGMCHKLVLEKPNLHFDRPNTSVSDP
jgi:hypothetical protein